MKSNGQATLCQTSLNIFQAEIFEKLIAQLIANLFKEVETNRFVDWPKILKTIQVFFELTSSTST